MSTQSRKEEKEWWRITKAVAYELKPFSLPTVEDVSNAGTFVRTNVGQITAEIKRVTPEAVRLVKDLNPLRALGLFTWLCGWAFFIWLEFGAVYFIVSAMAGIFVNLGEREEGEWSAYSVFNAGCRALLGTINAEQFEREIMRQNIAAPDGEDDEDDDLLLNDQEDDFVWVEPEPGVRIPPAADDDVGAHEPEADNERNNDNEDQVQGGGGGAARGAGGGGGRRVSGKRARRGFEERRERREERRLALQALGEDEWD